MYNIGQVIEDKWIIESEIIDVDNVTGYVCRNIETDEYKIIDIDYN
ncbi:hypothetical protein HYH33_16705 [Clostridium botulinum]|nr:hypothetical protein [Clostridium botulinum]MBY6815174.1 hypothetical protein [Clostridium botulinum]MBY6821798.1 hypothetical protein [Clostridium botulinum]